MYIYICLYFSETRKSETIDLGSEAQFLLFIVNLGCWKILAYSAVFDINNDRM